MEVSGKLFMELCNELRCPHQVTVTQDWYLSPCQAPSRSPWVGLGFVLICLKLPTWSQTLTRKRRGPRHQEELPHWHSGEAKWDNNGTIFHHRVGKDGKRWATHKCWLNGEEVDTLPVLLEGVWIATSFGESLPAVFINNKNMHLLTIKKQSYFGDFILQE